VTWSRRPVQHDQDLLWLKGELLEIEQQRKTIEAKMAHTEHAPSGTRQSRYQALLDLERYKEEVELSIKNRRASGAETAEVELEGFHGLQGSLRNVNTLIEY